MNYCMANQWLIISALINPVISRITSTGCGFMFIVTISSFVGQCVCT